MMTMKGKVRRFLASLLSFIMLVNMVPESALTVYADPGDPEAHVHCVCASDTPCGDGHAADIEWTAWDSTTELPTEVTDELSHYYLTQDITLDENYTADDGLFLCLNGHTVDMNGYMYKSEGTLTITNCSEEGGFVEHNKDTDNYYLLNVRNLTMYNIMIGVSKVVFS